MTIDSDIGCLKTFEMFHNVDPSRLKLVALMGERLNFKPGEMLIHAGDFSQAVYFILSGEIEIKSPTADEHSSTFVLGRGSVFGDVPLLCNKPYVGNVKALIHSELLRVPRQVYFDLMASVPDFAVSVAKDLASRLYRVTTRVIGPQQTGTTLPSITIPRTRP